MLWNVSLKLYNRLTPSNMPPNTFVLNTPRCPCCAEQSMDFNFLQLRDQSQHVEHHDSTKRTIWVYNIKWHGLLDPTKRNFEAGILSNLQSPMVPLFHKSQITPIIQKYYRFVPIWSIIQKNAVTLQTVSANDGNNKHCPTCLQTGHLEILKAEIQEGYTEDQTGDDTALLLNPWGKLV